ncbi:MAG: glycosyltransferase family 9 protein [Bacteroidales bacterium]|nr:glycosyltransferase family 9 protein [Bacteroidales bacterium]MDD2812322.1 glycosyltransferase family 9 protein [Bacteroidales bacterium]MDD4811935.1 glycosyltransferase family 9 protein [Bacteroidales bacterium]
MRTLVVFRLSSMGDVLLTLPVVRGVLRANPDIQIRLVTSTCFSPYFRGIQRLEIISFDRHQPSGLIGLLRLFGRIRGGGSVDQVIDLHGVLRTYILDFLFIISLRPVRIVRKYRSQRRKIIKGREVPLMPHTTNRYLDVFRKAGFRVAMETRPMDHILGEIEERVRRSRSYHIGIAPMAKHRTKMWGEESVIQLLEILGKQEDFEIHLFGGRDERQALQRMARQGQRVEAGLHNPIDELRIIASMDVFVSMDSANMHLASLAGVPTLSIWGATHPEMGFSPLNQPPDYLIQASCDEVPCRPCSVYGESPCHLRSDPMRCMKLITPDTVAEKILQIIAFHKIQ